MQYNTMVHGSRVAGFPADLITSQRHTIVSTVLQAAGSPGHLLSIIVRRYSIGNAIVSLAQALRAVI